MIDVVEILQHWYAGRPKTVVAASLKVDPKTIRKYVAPAEAAGLVPGGPPRSRAEWVNLVREWFPELVDAKVRSLTYPRINAHRDQIERWLKDDVTVATIWQRLRDEAGLDVGVSSVRRYMRLEFPDQVGADQVTVPRPEVAPGDEGQIDWGFLGSWLDPLTERVRRVWAFVVVLAASRHMFVRPMLSMTQPAWCEAHVAAFEFFGGVVARLVPDNLRTGVDRPDLYDPKLNRSYADLAEHYGCLVDPARAGKPKDKPRVERPMPYIRDSFWRGRDWTSVEQMQEAALVWCRQVAGGRSHRSLGGATPYNVFLATEADKLLALPPEPFELATWSQPKVAADAHVAVKGALYSVPWQHIGRRVDARLTDRRVEIFAEGILVKTHSRVAKGKRSTDWADYPPEKIAFFQRTPAWCRRRAGELGPAVAEIVGLLLDPSNALSRLRAAQGTIGLAERYSPERLDAACRRAIEVGDPTYRTVKGILAVEGEAVRDEGVGDAADTPAHLHGVDSLFESEEETG